MLAPPTPPPMIITCACDGNSDMFGSLIFALRLSGTEGAPPLRPKGVLGLVMLWLARQILDAPSGQQYRMRRLRRVEMHPGLPGLSPRGDGDGSESFCLRPRAGWHGCRSSVPGALRRAQPVFRPGHS